MWNFLIRVGSQSKMRSPPLTFIGLKTIRDIEETCTLE